MMSACLLEPTAASVQFTGTGEVSSCHTSLPPHDRYQLFVQLESDSGSSLTEVNFMRLPDCKSDLNGPRESRMIRITDKRSPWVEVWAEARAVGQFWIGAEEGTRIRVRLDVEDTNIEWAWLGLTGARLGLICSASWLFFKQVSCSKRLMDV